MYAVFVLNRIVWGLIFLTTEFILQVSDKYGPGVLLNFILGKYHKPREETRIFMFLDIKSSTAIAESLGNKKYFKLLNDFFCDVTETILDTKGEIYQYVGDEIVISWNLNTYKAIITSTDYREVLIYYLLFSEVIKYSSLFIIIL